MAPRFIPTGDGTYELLLLVRLANSVPRDINAEIASETQESESTVVATVNTKCDGRDAYATNDLFVPHPSRPGLWKIIGKKDDQITLSTAYKVWIFIFGFSNSYDGPDGPRPSRYISCLH